MISPICSRVSETSLEETNNALNEVVRPLITEDVTEIQQVNQNHELPRRPILNGPGHEKPIIFETLVSNYEPTPMGIPELGHAAVIDGVPPLLIERFNLDLNVVPILSLSENRNLEHSSPVSSLVQVSPLVNDD